MVTQTSVIERSGLLSTTMFDASLFDREGQTFLRVAIPDLSSAALTSGVDPKAIDPSSVVKLKLRASSTAMIGMPPAIALGRYDEFCSDRVIDTIPVDARIARHISLDISVVDPVSNRRVLLAESIPLYGKSHRADDPRSSGFVHVRVSEDLKQLGLAWRVVVTEAQPPYIEVPPAHGDHPGKALLSDDTVLMPIIDALCARMTYMILDKDAEAAGSSGRSAWMNKWWATLSTMAIRQGEACVSIYEDALDHSAEPFPTLDAKADFVDQATRIYRTACKLDKRFLNGLLSKGQA